VNPLAGGGPEADVADVNFVGSIRSSAQSIPLAQDGRCVCFDGGAHVHSTIKQTIDGREAYDLLKLSICTYAYNQAPIQTSVRSVCAAPQVSTAADHSCITMRYWNVIKDIAWNAATDQLAAGSFDRKLKGGSVSVQMCAGWT
jgi:hypothetical protein